MTTRRFGDDELIQSEAVTAGAVRQSIGALDGDRPPVFPCPTCGADVGDWHTDDCVRGQLAQAQERERAALVREAWLRRVVEDAQSAPQRAQEWMRANGVQVADPSVPMQRAVFEVYNLLVELAQQAEAVLADTPEPSDRPNIQNGTHLEALQTGAGAGMTDYTSEGQARPPGAYGEATHTFGGGGRE